MHLPSRSRRTAVYAFLAGTLALAGCSDILGSGRIIPVEEIRMENDAGRSFAVAGSGGTSHFRLAIADDETLHVRFRFANRNGVPASNPDEYSVEISGITNPALLEWRKEAARSGTFMGKANGFTAFRLQLIRNSTVQYSATVQVEVYPSE